MDEGELTETEKNFGWFTQANIKSCEGQWVAIVDKKVVAAGRTIAEVEKAGTEKTGRDEFPIYLAEKGLRVYNH